MTRGVSADGQVVVGSRQNASSFDEAFRWTEAGGMVGLGDLPGGSFRSEAFDANADGSNIVGEGQTEYGGAPFIWDFAHGMRNLIDVWTNNYALGTELAGWTARAL